MLSIEELPGREGHLSTGDGSGTIHGHRNWYLHKRS